MNRATALECLKFMAAVHKMKEEEQTDLDDIIEVHDTHL